MNQFDKPGIRTASFRRGFTLIEIMVVVVIMVVMVVAMIAVMMMGHRAGEDLGRIHGKHRLLLLPRHGLAQLVAGTLEVWMLHTMHSFFSSVTLQADPPISALRGAVTAHANAAYQGQQLCRHGILQVCFWRATQALPETSSYPP